MHRTTRDIGSIAERAVEDYVHSNGYRLIVRNFYIHNVGELDLVFEKNREIFVIEVRARQTNKYYPNAIESVTFEKQRKIRRTTQYLLRKFELYERNIHFLVGCVTISSECLIQNVELIPF